MIKTFFRAQRTRIFWVAVVLLALLAGSVVWYKNIYSDPRRVFDAMLENSLRTASVTKQVIQSEDSQSLDQRLRLQNGENHTVQGVTDLRQTGLASAEVVTESIGTPTADFVRYRSIHTDQKSEDGGELDFSKVLNVWGRTEAAQETSGELYNETVLGVIPIGNLPTAERKKLLDLARELEVYKVEYARVQRTVTNGRPTYEYTVKVLPEAYVTFLKAYADAVGLTHLRNVRAADYENATPLEFKVSVDVYSRRLSSISYASGRSENYLNYGQRVDVDIPKDSVTVEELQTLIQQVQ
jgi:hypothetical protein